MKCWKCGSNLQKRSYGFYCTVCKRVRKFKRVSWRYVSKKIEIQKLPRNASIFLEDTFRRQLIERAIKKAESMRQLGRVMGYSGGSPNWSIKQIRQGNQGIPVFRLERLCEFMNVSFADIEKNVKRIRR